MEAHKMMELMASSLGGQEKTPKKPKLHMHIHQMDDGKFHVQHDYRGGHTLDTMPESSEHAPTDMAALHQHIDKHYGTAE